MITKEQAKEILDLAIELKDAGQHLESEMIEGYSIAALNTAIEDNDIAQKNLEQYLETITA